MLAADLLASGQIRYAPEGQRGQLFNSPGRFLRALRVMHGEPAPTGDSWRLVNYKGIPLSLLRDATMSEEAALAAIAAQSSLGQQEEAPNGPGVRQPKRSPTPVSAGGFNTGDWRPARKRAREAHSVSSERVDLDSGDESEALHNVRCDVCGSAEDERGMLLCDGCSSGVHLGCLNPPLSLVPVGEWFCGACGDERGESSGEPSGSSSRGEVEMFEVQKILDKRQARGRVEYLVRWKGFDSSADSWEPRMGLSGCKEQLRAFESERRVARAPPPPPPPLPRPPPQAASPPTQSPPTHESSASTSSGPALGAPPAGRGGAPAPPQTLPNLEADAEEAGPDRCLCRTTCALLPLLERELLAPGEGVLSVCCKGTLSFADVRADGSIASVGRGGQKLVHQFPCSWLRASRQRAGCPPLSAARSANISALVNYKGVRLDMVRPTPQRQSRR